MGECTAKKEIRLVQTIQTSKSSTSKQKLYFILHMHMYMQMHKHTNTFSLKHMHAHTHALSNRHAHTHTHTHTHTHIHMFSLFLSLSHTHNTPLPVQTISNFSWSHIQNNTDLLHSLQLKQELMLQYSLFFGASKVKQRHSNSCHPKKIKM